MHFGWWSERRRRRGSGGFTLAELVIVIAVTGVLLAAIYLIFQSGRETGTQISDRHEAGVSARLAVEELEAYLSHAGYTGVAPAGSWHPLRLAGRDRMVFVANLEDPGSFGPEDTLTLERDGQDRLVVMNAAGETVFSGSVPATIEFSYLDGSGVALSDAELADQAGLDRVRQISYSVSTGAGRDFTMSNVSVPRNLAFSGESPEFLESFLPAHLDGGGNDIMFFEETWETAGYYSFYDSIEAIPGWVPIITEDFETSASWINNWILYSSASNGRIRRLNDSGAHGGFYDMALDASPPGLVNLNGAIWRVDLSGYDEYTDSLRLHWFWMEYNDEADSEDGVYFPDYLGGSETLISSEDFTGYGNGLRFPWEYWNTAYGQVRVLDNAWSQPGGTEFLNMDSHQDGVFSQNRAIWTNDLSAYSASPDMELRFMFCDRGDESHNSDTGDFVGVIEDDPGGTPYICEYLDPNAYPDGAWLQRVVDLDAVVPAGYDWSNFRVVFGQHDDQMTSSATGNDGISIDDVMIYENVPGDTQFNDQIAAVPASFAAWTEEFADLSGAAQSYGRPFGPDYDIAWCQMGSDSMPDDGIKVDDIAIEEFGGWVIPGWTHGPFPGYTVDEWAPSQHKAYIGSWCWAMNEGATYTAANTHVWLLSPEIDLTGFAPGTRLSWAFFHDYEWAAGDGCNVKIWNPTTSNWDLAIPYWGYYNASIPALGGEAGWTGSTSGWNFCVVDITEYAGQMVQFRFEYGTMGAGTGDGWNIDLARQRFGPDWPQVIWYGWPTQEYADWFGWSTPPGIGDPATAGEGTRSAGNDMATFAPWDTYYELSTHNALVSPPVAFDDPGTYYYLEFLSYGTSYSGDTWYVECAPFAETIADTTWQTLGGWSGTSPYWWTTRFYLNPVMGALGCDTLVFRWRMLDNGDGTYNAGGWNVDLIQCFSSAAWLPEITMPVGGPGDGEDALVFSTEPAPRPRVSGLTGVTYTPVCLPDDEERPNRHELR